MAPFSESTRRTVVATGLKLAYTAPLVAASIKVSAINALAAVSPGGVTCVHSFVAPGFAGCMPACTSAGFKGKDCGVICGTGQNVGLCPVGQGDENPCCNAGLCDPANFVLEKGVVKYVGPTAGCEGLLKQPKKSKQPSRSPRSKKRR